VRTHPRVLCLTATGTLSCVLAEEVQSAQRSYKGERVDRRSIIYHRLRGRAYEAWRAVKRGGVIFGTAACMLARLAS
jgi:hypothetical protein